MDPLDRLFLNAFDGKVVRKELLHRIKKGTNVPTFVLEFLLARYCASDEPDDVQERLGELRQSLLELDVALEVELNPTLHDREIRLDNGWVIKIGRGLDFYQKPATWHEIGVHDLALRRCLETKVDVFRINLAP